MTPDELNRLRGIKKDNDEAGARMEAMRPRFARMADRHLNGTAPRAVAAFQLFQTPPHIAAALADVLEMAPGARLLEPSAGLGRLLDAMRPYQAGETVAIEMAPTCAAELYRQDREGVRLLQRDFLTVTPDEIGQFDAVIMNPPFHLRADIRHILHAVRFLKPGGRLAALCLDTHERETRLKPLAAEWKKIPAGAFAKEGTRAACVLLTIHA